MFSSKSKQAGRRWETAILVESACRASSCVEERARGWQKIRSTKPSSTARNPMSCLAISWHYSRIWWSKRKRQSVLLSRQLRVQTLPSTIIRLQERANTNNVQKHWRKHLWQWRLRCSRRPQVVPPLSSRTLKAAVAARVDHRTPAIKANLRAEYCLLSPKVAHMSKREPLAFSQELPCRPSANWVAMSAWTWKHLAWLQASQTLRRFGLSPPGQVRKRACKQTCAWQWQQLELWTSERWQPALQQHRGDELEELPELWLIECWNMYTPSCSKSRNVINGARIRTNPLHGN